MRVLLLIMFLILLNSCCKDENCESTKLPDCIRQMIDVVGHTPPLISVKMQKVDGECHYWLNTDAMAWDGFEYIVDDQCDTLCTIGGFRMPVECMKKYDFDKWVTI